MRAPRQHLALVVCHGSPMKTISFNAKYRFPTLPCSGAERCASDAEMRNQVHGSTIG